MPMSARSSTICRRHIDAMIQRRLLRKLLWSRLVTYNRRFPMRNRASWARAPGRPLPAEVRIQDVRRHILIYYILDTERWVRRAPRMKQRWRLTDAPLSKKKSNRRGLATFG